MLPQPPYYTVNRRGAQLVLAAGGAHHECVAFVRTLEGQFGARITEEYDAGPLSDEFWPHPYDKEKGYWTLEIDGESFLLMRDRGRGMCLFGPPLGKQKTFLAIAELVGAERHWKFGQRLAAWLGIGP